MECEWSALITSIRLFLTFLEFRYLHNETDIILTLSTRIYILTLRLDSQNFEPKSSPKYLSIWWRMQSISLAQKRVIIHKLA